VIRALARHHSSDTDKVTFINWIAWSAMLCSTPSARIPTSWNPLQTREAHVEEHSGRIVADRAGG